MVIQIYTISSVVFFFFATIFYLSLHFSEEPGFLRVHLDPYLTLLVLALWTVAVTAAVVADMCLTALKQVGGIRMTQGVSGKRRIQLCLYKTFLQTCTDEGWCDESILAELLEDAIAEGWYPLNCYVGDFLQHM